MPTKKLPIKKPPRRQGRQEKERTGAVILVHIIIF